MPENTSSEELFYSVFSAKPDVSSYAPGRINLIGDHTDYNNGFVLPASIDLGTSISASSRDDRQIYIYSSSEPSGLQSFSIDDIAFQDEPMWINYVAGTLKILAEFFPNFRGADLAVDSNLPQGAGLSSSASFEIALLKVFAELFQLDLDGINAAKIAQRAENEFVGCNCGIMDQLISAQGVKGCALLLDCDDLSHQSIQIPEDVAIVILNSNVKRGLVESEYNLRRKQCDAAARFFGKPNLRQLDIDELNAAKSDIDETLYKRALHVVTENSRTCALKKALMNNDSAALSSLMRESHKSLSQDFEVSTKEVDILVEIVDGVLGDRGGVRMTGGGFGGCAVALAPHDSVELITKKAESLYPALTGLTPDIFVCKASQGAFTK